jgi:hypothetical protein
MKGRRRIGKVERRKMAKGLRGGGEKESRNRKMKRTEEEEGYKKEGV